MNFQFGEKKATPFILRAFQELYNKGMFIEGDLVNAYGEMIHVVSNSAYK